MNRSKINKKENRITAISASFYKTVFLLTQVVPPSFEFRQYFKKGMFDKPNTAGFLHVSHYLSVIYNKNLFKQMVSWPILCKRDELTYRSEIKNFFFVLSRDNTDIKFPSMPMSHLVQAGGTKFLIIMWKVSQLAFRAYIRKEFQGKLLYAPRAGLIDGLTVIYLKSITVEKSNIITKTHKETERFMNVASNSLKNEIKKMNIYKSEIFETKKKIEELVVYVPAQRRLIDVEDLDIIEMWKRSISEKFLHVYKKNKELNELEGLCDHLCKLTSRLTSTSEIFNANVFPETSNDNYLLYKQIEMQHFSVNLYVNGSIVFTTLLSSLMLISEQILYYLSAINPLNLSQCCSYIRNSYKDITFLQKLFSALDVRVSDMLVQEQLICQKVERAYPNFDMYNAFPINRSPLSQLPKINFGFEQCTDYNIYEKLCLSPMEGKCTHLFKRYKYKYYSTNEVSATLSDSTWDTVKKCLFPDTDSSKYGESSYNGKPISPLYSRLLHHTKLRAKRSRENISCNPNSSYERSNPMSSKRRRSLPSSSLTKDNYNYIAKNLFNSAVSPSLSYLSLDSKN